MAVVGAIMFGSGLSGTIATLLDLLVRPGIPHTEHSWQERLSLYATLIVVGLPVWLLPWLRLQREVVAAVARRSLARRHLSVPGPRDHCSDAARHGAFTLYQARVALGETWTASNTSNLLEAASAAAVAALLLAYHLRVSQHDAALARQDEEAEAAEEARVASAARPRTLVCWPMLTQ